MRLKETPVGLWVNFTTTTRALKFQRDGEISVRVRVLGQFNNFECNLSHWKMYVSLRWKRKVWYKSASAYSVYHHCLCYIFNHATWIHFKIRQYCLFWAQAFSQPTLSPSHLNCFCYYFCSRPNFREVGYVGNSLLARERLARPATSHQFQTVASAGLVSLWKSHFFVSIRGIPFFFCYLKH